MQTEYGSTNMTLWSAKCACELRSACRHMTQGGGGGIERGKSREKEEGKREDGEREREDRKPLAWSDAKTFFSHKDITYY